MSVLADLRMIKVYCQLSYCFFFSNYGLVVTAYLRLALVRKCSNIALIRVVGVVCLMKYCDYTSNIKTMYMVVQHTLFLLRLFLQISVKYLHFTNKGFLRSCLSVKY